MEDFKQRLVKEREELKERTDKLHDFLFSQAFMDLDVQQKTLLRDQYRDGYLTGLLSFSNCDVVLKKA